MKTFLISFLLSFYAENFISKTHKKRLKTLEGHSDWVNSVAYSPDGTKIISGSDDTTVKM